MPTVIGEMLGPSGKGLAPAAEEEMTCEVYAMMVGYRNPSRCFGADGLDLPCRVNATGTVWPQSILQGMGIEQKEGTEAQQL
jgi:hypothetical protein